MSDVPEVIQNGYQAVMSLVDADYDQLVRQTEVLQGIGASAMRGHPQFWVLQFHVTADTLAEKLNKLLELARTFDAHVKLQPIGTEIAFRRLGPGTSKP